MTDLSRAAAGSAFRQFKYPHILSIHFVLFGWRGLFSGPIFLKSAHSTCYLSSQSKAYEWVQDMLVVMKFPPVLLELVFWRSCIVFFLRFNFAFLSPFHKRYNVRSEQR